MEQEKYNQRQKKVLKSLRHMCLRGGGMENVLMLLKDFVEGTIDDCDERVRTGTASPTDGDIEYLRLLHKNLSRTYMDYCNRYGDQDDV